jgi:hypothetical protein
MDWIITTDNDSDLGPEFNRLGIGIYRGARSPLVKAEPDPKRRKALVQAYLDHPATDLPFEFRLLDDDGEEYYRGRCGDLDQAPGDEAFAPLDWAMADAGCTEMQYRRVGHAVWKSL